MTFLNVFRYGSFRLGRITEEKKNKRYSQYETDIRHAFSKMQVFFKVHIYLSKKSMDAAVNGNFCATANILK
jgi:hypothetical protein